MTDHRQNQKPDQDGFLSNLSNEQLGYLVRREMDQEDPDVERLQRIGSILDTRNPQGPVDSQSAWVDFKEHCLGTEPVTLYEAPVEADICVPENPPDNVTPPEEDISSRSSNLHKRRRTVRIAVIAATLVVLVVGANVTAAALDINLYATVVNWGKETFWFLFPAETEQSATDEQSDSAEIPELLLPLQEALEEHGVTAAVLPTYIPDGYEVLELDVYDDELGWSIDFALQKDEEIISFGFMLQQDVSRGSEFQKDAGSPTMYSKGENTFYVTTNMEKYIAVWTCGEVECSISGVYDEEELYQIIDSIP